MLKSAVNAIRKLHSAKIQILRAAAHTCVSIELESLEVVMKTRTHQVLKEPFNLTQNL